jgi:hypothetical protein
MTVSYLLCKKAHVGVSCVNLLAACIAGHNRLILCALTNEREYTAECAFCNGIHDCRVFCVGHFIIAQNPRQLRPECQELNTFIYIYLIYRLSKITADRVP